MEAVRYTQRSRANDDFAPALNLALATGSLAPVDALHACFFPPTQSQPLNTPPAAATTPAFHYAGAPDAEEPLVSGTGGMDDHDDNEGDNDSDDDGSGSTASFLAMTARSTAEAETAVARLVLALAQTQLESATAAGDAAAAAALRTAVRQGAASLAAAARSVERFAHTPAVLFFGAGGADGAPVEEAAVEHIAVLDDLGARAGLLPRSVAALADEYGAFLLRQLQLLSSDASGALDALYAETLVAAVDLAVSCGSEDLLLRVWHGIDWRAVAERMSTGSKNNNVKKACEAVLACFEARSTRLAWAARTAQLLYPPRGMLSPALCSVLLPPLAALHARATAAGDGAQQRAGAARLDAVDSIAAAAAGVYCSGPFGVCRVALTPGVPAVVPAALADAAPLPHARLVAVRGTLLALALDPAHACALQLDADLRVRATVPLPPELLALPAPAFVSAGRSSDVLVVYVPPDSESMSSTSSSSSSRTLLMLRRLYVEFGNTDEGNDEVPVLTGLEMEPAEAAVMLALPRGVVLRRGTPVAAFANEIELDVFCTRAGTPGVHLACFDLPTRRLKRVRLAHDTCTVCCACYDPARHATLECVERHAQLVLTAQVLSSFQFTLPADVPDKDSASASPQEFAAAVEACGWRSSR